jgi:hypothetical protein
MRRTPKRTLSRTAGLLATVIIAAIVGVSMPATASAATTVSAADVAEATADPIAITNVSVSLGDHIYIKFNRAETVKIVKYTSIGATATAVTAACVVLVPTTGPLSVGLCAGAAAVIAAMVSDYTNAWIAAHPHKCLTEVIKFIPFTGATHGEWRTC